MLAAAHLHAEGAPVAVFLDGPKGRVAVRLAEARTLINIHNIRIMLCMCVYIYIYII